MLRSRRHKAPLAAHTGALADASQAPEAWRAPLPEAQTARPQPEPSAPQGRKDPPAPPPASRRRRRLHRLLILLALLLIVVGLGAPAAAVYYLCFTEPGIQSIVSLIPRQIGDTQIEVEGVKGTLAHGFSVERVDVDERVVHVRVEGFRGHLTLAALLLQTLRSHDATVRNVIVAVKAHPVPPKRITPPSFLPRWMVISLEHTKIAQASVILASGTPLTGKDLLITSILRHESIRFFEAQLQHDDIHLSGTGELGAANPMKLDVDLRMGWAPREQPAWLFAGSFKGDLDSLAMKLQTLQPFRTDFTGRMLSLNHTDHWRWLGNAEVKDFSLAPWQRTPGPLGIINGQLHLQGDRHGFGADGTATPQGLHAGLFDVVFQGYYQNRVLTAQHMELRHHGSGAHATGQGTFGFVPHGPQVDITGTWQDFRWPLPATEPPFSSSAADFSISGMMPYHVTARGIGQIASLPPMPMEIRDGTILRGGFKLDDGAVDLYDGHAQLNGQVTWSGGQSWKLQSEVNNVSLGAVREDLPGRVSFAIAARGNSFAASQDLDIDIRGLDGTVRAQAAHGSGHFSRTRGSWEFDSVYANLGKTRLSLNGVLAQTMDLRFSLSADDLSLMGPESRGLMRASGSVRGTLETPVIDASVHGTGILHKGVSLDELDAMINFDPHAQRDSKVDLHVKNLRRGARTLDSFDLSLSGRPENYALRSQMAAEGLHATATANGAYTHGQFAGQLETLSVHGRNALQLELAKPVALRLSSEHAQIERACLQGKPASLCAEGDWTPAQWTSTVSASELPIDSLTSGLSASQLTYEGTVKILANLWGGGGAPVQGTLRADLNNAQLVHTLLSGRVEHTALGSGTILASAGKSTFTASATLQDGQIGTLSASLNAPRGQEPWQDMPLTAQVHAQTSQLDLLSLYLPDIDRAAGHLTADAQITGTLGKPHLAGELRIADAEMDLFQVNLRLRQLQIATTLTDRGIDFNGQAHIGEGALTAGGQLQWRDSLPYGQLSLTGKNLRVVDVPEAHIDASPDLRFNISGAQMEVSGNVDVPYAHIEPRDLSAAVRTSSDEVLVGTDNTAHAKHAQILSSINLHLGDKVNIATSGLTARLTGNLAVKSGYEATTRATGQLNIVEGKYVAYAHNFDIQSGTLIFTGGAVDNPGINIKAARKFPDVTAGVQVQGTLTQPRMSFFSVPSLPQSEIVSLILSGGSLASAQARDRAGASSEAMFQGGAVLLQQLGSQVGVQDVGVQTDPYNVNETSLVLGKYLSPRLYVSYGVSLTDQLQVLKLRYSLGDHWTVNTEMGQARGADLLFSIDR